MSQARTTATRGGERWRRNTSRAGGAGGSVSLRTCVLCSAQTFHFVLEKIIKSTFYNFCQNEVKCLWLVLLYLFSFLRRRPPRSENSFFSLRFGCFTSFRFHFRPLVDALTPLCLNKFQEKSGSSEKMIKKNSLIRNPKLVISGYQFLALE